VSADTVVNVAKAAWDIIKEGKPAMDLDKNTANAVPQVTDWQALEGTRGPMSVWMTDEVAFIWPADNYLHVDLKILLKWDYGATYRGGGAFIPNVYTEVPTCFVGWGWNANIQMIVRNPTNAGSVEAPIARLPVTILGTVSSGAESYHVEWGYIIDGNGNWTQ
jgi:hypothetical protein